jgi:hypothetical protein
MAWSDRFDHPIRWGARSIHTLHDARVFILGLSRVQQIVPAWLGAYTLLLQAAESGGPWRDLARIGIMNALLGSIAEFRAAEASLVPSQKQIRRGRALRPASPGGLLSE